MGLGFSYHTGDSQDDFALIGPSWAYGGFNRFRRKLAAAEGLDLECMAGFIPHGISWDTTDTPLKALLYHSDCDGELTPEEMRLVAPRLKEIAADWPVGDYDRDAALELVAAMEHLVAIDTNLEFC